MQGRPSSSARPTTSARPSTAFDRDQFQYQQQHLQQQQPYGLEEEYEESDDEDVFAFLPPSTADQVERQSTSFAFGNHVQYPEPTFDPWGRQYPLSPPIPAAASSTDFTADTSSPSPPHATAVPTSIPSPACVHSYSYNQPPPSPSTDSNPSTGMSGPDSYHLKRLGVVNDIQEIEKKPQADGENEAEEKGDPNDSAGLSHSHSQSDPQKSDQAGTGIPQATSSLADSLTMADDESRNIK